MRQNAIAFARVQWTLGRRPGMTMWGGKCVSLPPSDPLAVDRVLAADELDIGRAARIIDFERPPQGRDHLGRLADPLGVEAEGAYHLRHIHLVGPQHPVGEGIVSWPPEAGAIARKAAIADVHDRNPELLAQQNLEIAEHVAEARLAGHRHRSPLRKSLLGGNRSSQAE